MEPQTTDIDWSTGEERGVPPRTKVWFVAVYMVDKAFGGHEEGGWWYDVGELVRVNRSFKNESLAYAYARRMNDRLERTLNKDRREISSVLSEGRYSARVCDDLPTRHFPLLRPHYE